MLIKHFVLVVAMIIRKIYKINVFYVIYKNAYIVIILIIVLNVKMDMIIKRIVHNAKMAILKMYKINVFYVI